MLPAHHTHLKGRFVETVWPVVGVSGEEDAGRVFHRGVVVLDLAVEQKHGYGRDQDDYPSDGYGEDGVALGSHGHGGDGVDDGEEAVQAHQHQGVNTGAGSNHYQILHHLAPSVAEWPEGEYVICGGEGDAEDDETEIGDRQVDDQQVGGTSHLLVDEHHQHDQSVPDQPEDDDDAEQHGHHDTDYLLHDSKLGLHVVRDSPVVTVGLAEGGEYVTTVSGQVEALGVTDSLPGRVRRTHCRLTSLAPPVTTDSSLLTAVRATSTLLPPHRPTRNPLPHRSSAVPLTCYLITDLYQPVD